MNNTDLVKLIVNAFCDNTNDQDVLDRHFHPSFEHWANGTKSGLGEYASRLQRYGDGYTNFGVFDWDEVIGKDDAVVTGYVLDAYRKDGGTDRFAVMAIWRLSEGKVVSLREVDASI